MATIKFTDYNRLKRAEVSAKAEYEHKRDNLIEGSHEARYAEERLDKIQSLKDLYDFGRHGAIYIDSGEVSLIKRFTPEW